MDYKKIQIILIIFLVFTNLFLAINYTMTIYTDKKIMDDMYHAQMEILQNKNIKISENLLSKTFDTSVKYQYNKISSEHILKLVGPDTEEKNNLYVSDYASAKLNNDGSFFILINKAFSESEIKNYLTSAGFLLKEPAQIVDDNHTLRFTYQINNTPVRNAFLDIVLSSRNTSISGNYLFEHKNSILVEEHLDLFRILLRMPYVFETPTEISDISLLYEITNLNTVSSIHQIDPILYIDCNLFTVRYHIETQTYEKILK